MAELKRSWGAVRILVTAIILAGLIAVAGIFSGAYDVAADAPHTGPVLHILKMIRIRSIVVHAQGIAVPGDLADTKRIAAGAAEYAEMCSQCHLSPGMENTEISQGLYPNAPQFAHGDSSLSEPEQFWVVKHGIKFTPMPAWGPTHEDALLWNIVAFVHKLPALSAAQYKTMTANAPEEHEQMMKDMPAMGDSDHRH